MKKTLFLKSLLLLIIFGYSTAIAQTDGGIPLISSVSPTSGNIGTKVELRGKFEKGGAIMFVPKTSSCSVLEFFVNANSEYFEFIIPESVPNVCAGVGQDGKQPMSKILPGEYETYSLGSKQCPSCLDDKSNTEIFVVTESSGSIVKPNPETSVDKNINVSATNETKSKDNNLSTEFEVRIEDGSEINSGEKSFIDIIEFYFQKFLNIFFR